MAHDGDLGGDERLDHGHPGPATLELHGLGAGPHQGGGVADGVLHRHVVAEPRQVADHQGPGRRPAHGGDVMGHDPHVDLQGVGVAEHVVGHRVAHQDHVDPGGVGDARPGGVVGGEHDEGLTAARTLAGTDLGDRDLGCHVGPPCRPAHEGCRRRRDRVLVLVQCTVPPWLRNGSSPGDDVRELRRGRRAARAGAPRLPRDRRGRGAAAGPDDARGRTVVPGLSGRSTPTSRPGIDPTWPGRPLSSTTGAASPSTSPPRTSGARSSTASDSRRGGRGCVSSASRGPVSRPGRCCTGWCRRRCPTPCGSRWCSIAAPGRPASTPPSTATSRARRASCSSPATTGTLAEVSWTIEMTQRTMRLAARVAHPLMRWGHDRVIEATVSGYRRQLAAQLGGNPGGN